ncbi:MAG TPA: BatA domain-containing protein [Cyclobacteriaceae bacterium]|nr:BatA domain-containing protein [Cyclobacteriaceae bacterium]
MNFLFPQFLWALTALSIPIIIHLFNFRKTTRILFSNTRFLQQVRQETTQKRKLKQYLVLASRLLFLLFLVLAFAQPFLPAKEQLTPGREVAIYLDNSYSMLSQVAEKTRALDAGIRFSQEVVELFPLDTRYKLITNDFAPFSNSFKTKTEILDLLAQVRLSPVARSFNEVSQRIGGSDQEIFWISDFQKSTSGEISPTSVDSVQSWRLVPIALENSNNVFVDSAYLEDPFIVGGQRNTLNVRVRNMGAKAREGLVIKLIINDVQSGTASVNLESNSSAVAKFDLIQGLKGWNRAVVSFTDFPVSFDNEFYATLNFSDKIRIVEVSSGDSFIEKVFGNVSLFAFRSFELGNVDVGVLSQADLVILNNIDNPDASLMQAVRNYQQGTGTVLIVPSAKINLASYQALTPGIVLTKKENLEMAELDKPDFQNPFFENVFEERTASMAMPHVRSVIDWGADRSALLKFKDGKPFLSRVKNTFVLSAPLDTKYSDFQSHGIFVPVMYRIAASSHRVSQKPYYMLSESTITLTADSLDSDTPVRLTGKQEVVPAQRRNSDKLVLEIPKFSIDPGFYYARSRQDTIGLVAFDVDKKESLMEQWTGDDVKTMLGGGKNISLFDAAATGSFADEIKERYLGTALWKYALLLALLFLLAEVLLIRFLK